MKNLFRYLLLFLVSTVLIFSGCTNEPSEESNVQTPKICGNGIVESGEACDDGNTLETDSCLSTCVAASCGDNYVQAGVEECDDGNTVETDSCLSTCVAAFCGDNYIQAGIEECDDGNLTDGDGCESTCILPRCGNGILDIGEGCDDGNVTNGDGCESNCALPTCGDSIVDAGEGCDDGNADDTDFCLSTCVSASCGDNYVQAGVEECDDGNLTDADTCQSTCLLPVCGDGILDAGEGCDDGNLIDADTCQSTCALPTCGDGILDAGEDCDDGNSDDTDSCLSTCVTAFCGDNYVWAGLEDCDDGGIQSAACEANCTLPVCGDGIINEYISEVCDDNNNIDGDGCSAACTAITVTEPDVFETDNTPATASAIALNSSQFHTIHISGDIDYISVVITDTSKVYTFKTTDGTGLCDMDTIIYLYDTNGTTLLKSDDDSGYGGYGSCSLIVYQFSNTGTYYIKAKGFGTETGNYVFEVYDYARSNGSPTASTTGSMKLVGVGNSASLLGTSSYDSDSEICSGSGITAYQWQIINAPAGSSASIINDTLASASFTPDLAGTYEILLTVTDDTGLCAGGNKTNTAIHYLEAVSWPPAPVTPITESMTATSGEIISAGDKIWYSFEANAGSIYALFWNDEFKGDGTQTGDIRVSALSSSGPFFVAYDSGYARPGVINAVSTETIYVLVEGFQSHNTGTFTIKLLPTDATGRIYNNNFDNPLNVNSDAGIYISLEATSGTSYTVYWDDLIEGSGTYSLDATVSAYYYDGSVLFSGVDSGYITGQSFTANQNGPVFIHISPAVGGSTGTVGLKVSTP